MNDNGNPLAAHLLAELKQIVSEADGGWLRDSPEAKRVLRTIADAEGQGLRAQTFDERVTDLLNASNRHLENSRIARRRMMKLAADHQNVVATVGKMAASVQEFRASVERLLAVDVLIIAKALAGPRPKASPDSTEEPSWPVDVFELERTVITARSNAFGG